MDCIFCRIIKGEIPSYTVYEDDTVKAFLDINPDTNGHLLIIPKEHFKDLDSTNDTVLLHIFEVARSLKKKLEEQLHIDGLTLIQNNGEVQEVKHFHLHLKPYYKEEQSLMKVEDVHSLLTK
ncbi:MAG: HIT domain-containing protein [Bacilli bacterium]|nr:HIT domain-containing protein [Bacilli bacterium]